MKPVLLLLVVVCSIVIHVPCGEGDMFTAIAELEKILHVEQEVAEDLRDYIGKEEERLKVLRNLAEDLDRHSQKANKNPEDHLSNPINAYLLIKRFTSDWNNILEEQLKSRPMEEFLDKLNSKTQNFPTGEDLNGAGTALLRLQDTYALTTDKLARGDLQGISESAELTSDDCFLLATIAYNSSDFYHSVLWLNESLRRVGNSSENPEEVRSKTSLILDYLAYSYYKQGNIKKAENLTKEFLLLEPEHQRARANLVHFEKLRAGRADSEDYDDDFNPRTRSKDYKAHEEFQNYEKLCRGEKTQRTLNEHLFTCQYKRHHPFLLLRPAKEEVVNWEPKMFMYHDVMTEDQIQEIKTLGRPRLDRSVVFHKTEDGTTTPQDYRISKTGWLRDSEGASVKRFSFTAAAIGNLTLDYAEELQVLNYGIGGHYEPHFDFASNREPTEYEKVRGNRIATFICYLSDVQAGGATVFPYLGVSYFPRKGSCAFWYNLLRSGEGDKRTRHAACPVLSGVKWACNKWFRERGQEFIRPCTSSAEK